MAQVSDNVVFKDLNAEDADQGTTEIESCCMNCYENVSSILQLNACGVSVTIFVHYRASRDCC